MAREKNSLINGFNGIKDKHTDYSFFESSQAEYGKIVAIHIFWERHQALPAKEVLRYFNDKDIVTLIKTTFGKSSDLHIRGAREYFRRAKDDSGKVNTHNIREILDSLDERVYNEALVILGEVIDDLYKS